MGELNKELYIFERKRGMKDSEIRVKYGLSDFAMRKVLKEFNVPKDEMNIEPVREARKEDLQRINESNPKFSLRGKQVYIYDLSVKCVAYYGYIVCAKGKYNCVEIIDIKEFQERNKNYKVFSDLLDVAERYSGEQGYQGIYLMANEIDTMDNVFRTAQYESYEVGKERLIAKVFNVDTNPIQAAIDDLKAKEAASKQARKEELMRKKQEAKEARKQARIEERLRPIREREEHIRNLYRTMRSAEDYELPTLQDNVVMIEGKERRLLETKEAYSEIYKKAFANKDSIEHLELIWNDLTPEQLYDLRFKDGLSYKALVDLFKVTMYKVYKKITYFKEQTILIETERSSGNVFHLQPVWYNKIKSGEKKIELRTNTLKIRCLQPGDTIIFINEENEKEQIEATILDKYEYRTFFELLSHLNFADLGCPNHTMDEMLSIMSKIYTYYEEMQHGAVGIRIKVK